MCEVIFLYLAQSDIWEKIVAEGPTMESGRWQHNSSCEDNWIPDIAPTTLQHISSRSGNDMVSSLIIKGEHKWNEETIRNIFSEDISEKILSLPLSTEGCPDFVSWPHTKDGVYTVRSAYNFLRTLNFWSDRSTDGKGAISDHKIMEKIWRKLWAIQCPNKMKVILWRLAHNCLPTGAQLQVRSIPTRYDCHFCNREETIEHCFL